MLSSGIMTDFKIKLKNIMKTAKKIANLLIILIILSFVLPQMVLAIGQMTKPIVLQDVLRGQEVTEVLNLFNSEDKEVTFGLKAEGQIESWASFYQIDDKNLENPITEIQIPPQSRLNAIVKFTVPKDTPNGEYSGEVAIFTLPSKDKKTGEMSVSVLQRVGREVSITVIDKEILKFETTIIPLKYGVRKAESLKIKVIYENLGNVSIKPDLQLKITQAGNTIFNAIFPYPEGEKAVRPFERKVFPNLIEWQTAGQEDGKYRAEIKILLDGKVIKEDRFRFTIGVDIEKMLGKVLAAIAWFGGGNLVLGWFIIGGVILAITIILNFLSKRKKQKFVKTEIQGEIIEGSEE